MFTGYNTDLQFNGETYHIQTQERGKKSSIIDTFLYKSGRILESLETSYETITKDADFEKNVRALMKKQHQRMAYLLKNERLPYTRKLLQKAKEHAKAADYVQAIRYIKEAVTLAPSNQEIQQLKQDVEKHLEPKKQRKYKTIIGSQKTFDETGPITTDTLLGDLDEEQAAPPPPETGELDLNAISQYSASTLIEHGIKYYETNQLKEALMLFEEAVSQDPNNLDAFELLEAVKTDLAKQRAPGEQTDYLFAFQGEEYLSVEQAIDKGFFLFGDMQYQAAKALWQEALKYDPKNEKLLSFIRKADEELGRQQTEAESDQEAGERTMFFETSPLLEEKPEQTDGDATVFINRDMLGPHEEGKASAKKDATREVLLPEGRTEEDVRVAAQETQMVDTAAFKAPQLPAEEKAEPLPQPVEDEGTKPIYAVSDPSEQEQEKAAEPIEETDKEPAEATSQIAAQDDMTVIGDARIYPPRDPRAAGRQAPAADDETGPIIPRIPTAPVQEPVEEPKEAAAAIEKETPAPQAEGVHDVDTDQVALGGGSDTAAAKEPAREQAGPEEPGADTLSEADHQAVSGYIFGDKVDAAQAEELEDADNLEEELELFEKEKTPLPKPIPKPVAPVERKTKPRMISHMIPYIAVIGLVIFLSALGLYLMFRHISHNALKEEARSLYAAGEFQKSLEKLNTVLGNKPKDLELLNMRAVSYEKTGSLEKARADLQRILELQEPPEAETLLFLANIEIQVQKHDEALAHAKQVLEIAPTASHYDQVGDIHLQADDVQAALAYYEKALEQDAKNYGILLKLSILYYQTGQLEQAKKGFNNLFAVDRTNSEYLYYLGLIYNAEEKYDKAVVYLQLSLDQDSDNFRARELLGDIYQKKRLPSQALNEFNNAILFLSDKVQEDPDLKRELANIYNKVGVLWLKKAISVKDVGGTIISNAVAAFEKAITLVPDAMALRQNVAKAYLLKGDNEQAIAAYEEAMKLEPQNAALYMDVAGIYLDKLKNRTEAYLVLKQGYERGAKDCEFLRRLMYQAQLYREAPEILNRYQQTFSEQNCQE